MRTVAKPISSGIQSLVVRNPEEGLELEVPYSLWLQTTIDNAYPSTVYAQMSEKVSFAVMSWYKENEPSSKWAQMDLPSFQKMFTEAYSKEYVIDESDKERGGVLDPLVSGGGLRNFLSSLSNSSHSVICSICVVICLIFTFLSIML